MTIKEWKKQGEDFAQGVSILETLSPKTHFLAKFQKEGPTDYNRAKLLYLLRDLEQQGAEQKKPMQKRQPLVIVAESVAIGHQTQTRYYPTPVAKAIERRAELVRKRNKLSNTLPSQNYPEERAATRAEIERLHTDIQGLNDYIGQWERTGNTNGLPVEKSPVSDAERDKLKEDLKRVLQKRNKASHQLNHLAEQNLPPHKHVSRETDLHLQYAQWNEKAEQIKKQLAGL